MKIHESLKLYSETVPALTKTYLNLNIGGMGN